HVPTSANGGNPVAGGGHMTRKLENKVALITGGTTGIGLATAKRFAAEGARVIVTGRNRETLEAARKELGDRAEVIESDAGDEKQIAELFEGVVTKTRAPGGFF